MSFWESLKNSFLKTRLTVFSAIAIIVYSSLQVVVMLLRQPVSDETWFLIIGQGVADVMAASGLITVVAEQTNLLGYGAIYWIIFGLAQYTPNAFLTMRWLAWLAVTLIPLMIMLRGRALQSQYTGCAVALWLIMPVAWWDGKLIGPDLYTVAIVAVGLVGILTERWRWAWPLGWMLLGIALGIKLYALPVLVYGAIMTLPRLRYGLAITIPIVIGFILANPFVVHGLLPWLNTIQQYSFPTNYSWDYLHYIMSNNAWTWDHVRIGGLLQVSFNGLSWICFIVFCILAKVSKKTLLAGGMAIATASVMFLSNNGYYYGWYWFPTLLVLPFMILEAQRFTTRLKVLAGVIVALAAVTSLPIIYMNYQNQSNIVS